MKKSSIRHLLGIFCAAIAVSVLLTTGAAAAHPETAHALPWDGWYIYVDDTPVAISDESGQYQWPLVYQGTVYIPLQTASEWLGCTFAWSEADGAITLNRAGAPYYRHAVEDQDYQVWRVTTIDQYRQDRKTGVGIELRPDITVYLDGEPQRFADVNGQATYPVLYRGVLFLPIRGVARMRGKEIAYLPKQEASPGVRGTSVTDFSLLFEPVLSQDAPAHIFLYDSPTQAQLDGAQNFLDEAQSLLYKGPVSALEALLTRGNLSTEDAAALVARISDGLEELAALPRPEAAFLAVQYEAIRSHCADMWDWLSERYASGLESRALDVEALRRDGTFSEMATQYLYWIRLDINRGQWMLDTVRAQME